MTARNPGGDLPLQARKAFGFLIRLLPGVCAALSFALVLTGRLRELSAASWRDTAAVGLVVAALV
ncbi:MAG TPA: hypothetical protein DFS52_17365, partial [Myxococcales bacterium]|nr:hypothetical protein [Myxococcales bacterium]